MDIGSTLENLFMAIMFPLSVGFTLLMFGVLVYEYFRIGFSELFQRSKNDQNRFDK